MKRQLLVALALALLPSLAYALPAVTYLELDGNDGSGGAGDENVYPCSGTLTDRTIHAYAEAPFGTDPGTRIRWHIDGPLNGSDGSVIHKVSANDVLGSDLADTWTSVVHCDDWGDYNVWAELLAPLGQQCVSPYPCGYFGAGGPYTTNYTASFVGPLDIQSPSIVKNSCNQFTMTGYLIDAYALGTQLVPAFPVHYEVTAQKTGGGTVTVSGDVSTGCVSCGGNKGKFTVIANFTTGQVTNGTLSFWTKHGTISTFPDPFFSKTTTFPVSGCP